MLVLDMFPLVICLLMEEKFPIMTTGVFFYRYCGGISQAVDGRTKLTVCH